MEPIEVKQYTAKDFKSDQYVRWCPACGDYAILNVLQKVMAELGVSPTNTAVISGIGCSSRLPYYINGFGFHTIHGRGAAIATGVKVANPELTVWQITGDGDCLAIGGNHFIHSVRRNVDINVLLFNNQIYGLTKGQFSPTSKKGWVTKSSPYGTVEEPFQPGQLTIGANGSFFGRLLDVDLKSSQMTMTAAARHKGASIVECLVNCIIFNDGAHSYLSEKASREDRIVVLEHGKKMIFGKEKNKGLVLDGLKLKVVTIGEDGITEDDILTHDAETPDPTLHLMLVRMQAPDFPIAIGVIRDVPGETFDQAISNQIAQEQAKSKVKSFDDLIETLEQWTV